MKYRLFKCPKCGTEYSFSFWDDATRIHMNRNKMPRKAFKSIRECVGKYHRNYVCPGCLQISSMKEITPI